jgi:excisionase family DNA binding protein
VAEYFGVSMTTVYRWCRERRIRCMKIGKHWRVRGEELVDFLKKTEEYRGA